MDRSFVRRHHPRIDDGPFSAEAAPHVTTSPLGAAQGASRTARIAARLRAGVADVCAEGFVALLDPGCPAGPAPCGSFHPRVAQRQRRSI